ncbi:sugar phosphate nucleotidyltransferase [Ruminococcus flavefaciens]|uniref:Nucleotidyl transferase n=1 Tax=Ruminococcus flavefaciens TaxID=1265 RepID=A0A1M7GAS2_RUMFL|nr:sugar phosphate nucleotidyltransferase [Ruminococcus flavefaciens]SHM13198.1 Nucleotidyl transferase [Ruminococcus flavefaciens]
MKKILVILAAGIGSRYGGGIKQLEAVDDQGHLIIDYSIHDAIAAGFNKIVFIIRHDIEEDFRERIGKRIKNIAAPLGVELEYAFQEVSYLPQMSNEDMVRLSSRTKPWGTGHAVLCAADFIDAPFAVINADDYYGQEGFKKAAEFLDNNDYALVGYVLKNTLSENGGVTRGICTVDDDKLVSISETKNIVKNKDSAEADGKKLNSDSLVSMNFWCYPQMFLDVLKESFPRFLSELNDPMKDEYLLPVIADQMLKTGVKYSVLPTTAQWFGVTYKEDKPIVVENIHQLHSSGVYKEDLYSDLM